MIHRITISIISIIVAGGLWVSPVDADSWTLPKKQRYYSPNKKYLVEVTPKKLESQLKYFEDKVNSKEDAGAEKGLKNNRAMGAFNVRGADGRYSKRYEFPLVNEVSPVVALVSSSGRYVVTFDNWHSVGYGDDVVVIYRSNGSLIKKYSLEDLLTEGDIETLPRSVSSIWWGGEHYIDEVHGHLVLQVISNGNRAGQDGGKFLELRIRLATGDPVEPKRDRFPQLRVFSSVFSSVNIGVALETSPLG